MSGNSSIIEPVVVDIGRYEVRLGDRTVRLEKIPMELLILLIENWDQVVPRQEIADRLWGADVFTDIDNGINTAVRKVRAALHDDPEQPIYIQTTIGRGYRFIGPAILIPPEREIARIMSREGA